MVQHSAGVVRQPPEDQVTILAEMRVGPALLQMLCSGFLSDFAVAKQAAFSVPGEPKKLEVATVPE